MTIPLELAFHNMEHSDAVERRVKEKTAALKKHFERITHCRVVIEAPHRNHAKGKIYHVKIDIGVPGRANVIVNREKEVNHAHEDVYVALRDAFEAARRQLSDTVDKMDGKVKTLRGGKRPPNGESAA